MSATLLRRNDIFYIVSSVKNRRIWKSLRTNNEDEARRLFENYEREHNRTTNYRLSSFSEDFQKRARLNFSEGTVRIYALALKTFIRLCGDIPIQRITTYDVETFKQLRAKEVSPVTLNIDLRTLRAAFNDAKRLKFIDDNPFQGVKLARLPNTEAPFLSEVEFRRLVLAIDDFNFRNLVVFALFTMMRRAEIINLRWADVDMVRKIIHIRSHEGFRVKGGKPRIVPMCQWVHDYLFQMNRINEYVFVDKNHRPLLPGTVTRRFKYYLRKAGLDGKLHFHSLRHSGISYLVNKGVPQEFVRRLAGHSSVVMTEIYTHLEDPTLFAAVNQFPHLKVAS